MVKEPETKICVVCKKAITEDDHSTSLTARPSGKAVHFCSNKCWEIGTERAIANAGRKR